MNPKSLFVTKNEDSGQNETETDPIGDTMDPKRLSIEVYMDTQRCDIGKVMHTIKIQIGNLIDPYMIPIRKRIQLKQFRLELC